jgi:hypothetical protein
MKIDLNELIPGATHFYWKEMLWLPTWKIHCFPTKTQHKNIINIVSTLEKIRDIFKKPIIITSGLRPELYNDIIGGAYFSKHREGKACDFYILDYEGGAGCNHVRGVLYPKLSELKIRMEKKIWANWVHIDSGEPISESRRFFVP